MARPSLLADLRFRSLTLEQRGVYCTVREEVDAAGEYHPTGRLGLWGSLANSLGCAEIDAREYIEQLSASGILKVSVSHLTLFAGTGYGPRGGIPKAVLMRRLRARRPSADAADETGNHLVTILSTEPVTTSVTEPVTARLAIDAKASARPVGIDSPPTSNNVGRRAGNATGNTPTTASPSPAPSAPGFSPSLSPLPPSLTPPPSPPPSPNPKIPEGPVGGKPPTGRSDSRGQIPPGLPGIMAMLQEPTASAERQQRITEAAAPTPKAATGTGAVTTRNTAVQEVFDHWRSVHGHPRAVLDAKRRGAIERAMKDYSIADIKSAIDGCKRSPYHQGKNETGTVYDDITLILRDATRTERFIGLAKSPASSVSIDCRHARRDRPLRGPAPCATAEELDEAEHLPDPLIAIANRTSNAAIKD